MLGDVGERFGGDEVRGGLDGGGRRRRVDEVDRDGRRRASAASAAARPRSVRMAGWMPRASSRSSASAAASFGVGLERGARRAARASVGELRSRELEREPDPEQALLGAVVEVALEPAAFGVAGLDDARARGAHLGELGAQLGLEARVLERERGGGADRVDEPGVVEQRGVVDERGEPVALVLEHRDRAAGLLRRGEPASVGVDVAPGSGSQKASSSEGSPSARAIASRTSPGCDARAERDDQLRDPRPVHPRPQQTDKERNRDEQ